MSPSTLNSAGSIQFRKESDQHGLSMTNRPPSTQVSGQSGLRQLTTLLPHQWTQGYKRVDVNIGRTLYGVVQTETIGYTDSDHPSVACSLNIHVRVADHHGDFGRNLEFAQYIQDGGGIRLFCGEAVSTVT